MKTYKVNHTGLVMVTDKEGRKREHRFEKNIPVDLPEEAAEALGDSAKETSESIPGRRVNPLNKMIGNNQATTK